MKIEDLLSQVNLPSLLRNPVEEQRRNHRQILDVPIYF